LRRGANLYNYDRKFYAKLSEKTAFQRDILKKVHRFTIILDIDRFMQREYIPKLLFNDVEMLIG
jgi:hypothetical protein